MSEINLQRHMSDAIRRIMVKAYSNALRNPLEAKTIWRLQQTFLKSKKRREAIKESEGVDVPPFLICSIATTCNLHCKGCYARANGIAADSSENQKPSLSQDEWKAVFEEAASLGINFALLAGGEPMMRRDILEERGFQVCDKSFTCKGAMGPVHKGHPGSDHHCQRIQVLSDNACLRKRPSGRPSRSADGF